jgi:hypothetical protein
MSLNTRREISHKYYQHIGDTILWKDLLRIFGIRIKKNIRANDVNYDHMAHCPFHKERTPSVRFYHHTRQFHCYGCGKHGDQFDFVALMLSHSYQKNRHRAFCWFKKNFNIPLPWENK